MSVSKCLRLSYTRMHFYQKLPEITHRLKSTHTRTYTDTHTHAQKKRPYSYDHILEKTHT